jgi:hypothetical protein
VSARNAKYACGKCGRPVVKLPPVPEIGADKWIHLLAADGDACDGGPPVLVDAVPGAPARGTFADSCWRALGSLDGEGTTRQVCDLLAEDVSDLTTQQVYSALRGLARRASPVVEIAVRGARGGVRPTRWRVTSCGRALLMTL